MAAVLDKLEWYFRVKERGSSWLGEVRAGVVLFMTSSYILFLNPLILSGQSGATNTGMPPSDIVLATSVSTGMATLLMGVVGNYPWVVSVQLGTNTYFVFNVLKPYQPCGVVDFVPYHTFFNNAGGKNNTCAGIPCTCVKTDTGFMVEEIGTPDNPGRCFGQKETADCLGTKVPYEQALAATFLEGIAFLLICATGLRGIILRYIPKTVLMAGAAAIGVFISFVGLRNMGLIVQNSYPTLTRFIAGNWPYQPNGYGGGDPSGIDMNSCVMYFGGPPFSVVCPWLSVGGLIFTGILCLWNFNGAFLAGILFTTFISWIKFPDKLKDGGLVPNKAVDTPTFQATAGALDFNWSENGNTGTLVGAFITFLYLDFLGSCITFVSMGQMQGIVDEVGNIPRSNIAFIADGFGSMMGGLLGSSALTTYVESAAAVREGGRTGVTAIVCAVLFFLMCFFAPIFSSINDIATGPILVLIGVFIYMEAAPELNWYDLSDAIPIFITIIAMPTTNNIAYGIIAGLIAYFLCKLVTFKFKFMRNLPGAALIHRWSDPNSRSMKMNIPGWNCDFDDYINRKNPLNNAYLKLLKGPSRKYGDECLTTMAFLEEEAKKKQVAAQAFHEFDDSPPVAPLGLKDSALAVTDKAPPGEANPHPIGTGGV